MQTQQVEKSEKCCEATLLQHILNKCLVIHHLLQDVPSRTLFISLIGDPKQISAFIWATSPGHLRKLNDYYCLMLADKRQPPAPILLKAGQALSDAVFTVKECEFSLSQNQHAMDACFVRLKDQVVEMTTLFLQHIDSYGKNVHLLLFLLRKQKEFDAMLGKGTIAKIYLSIFTSGLQEASQFLVSNYSKKGYTHLLPFIKNNLITMQKHDM